MKPFLIVKIGTTLDAIREKRGDFEDWILTRAGLSRVDAQIVDPRTGADLPAPGAFAGIIVTGSAAMVTDKEPWSVRLCAWLPEAVARNVPTLGICYGHQALAEAMGGRVQKNPRGREIGTISVELTEAAKNDAIFSALPPRIEVQATHLEAVTELPKGARVLGFNEKDTYQAFAIGANAWGVQFHPEFSSEVIRTYLEVRRDVIAKEGTDVDALLKGAHDTSHGETILRQFVKLARSASR